MIHAATKSATTFDSQAKISLGSTARTARIVSNPPAGCVLDPALFTGPGGWHDHLWRTGLSPSHRLLPAAVLAAGLAAAGVAAGSNVAYTSLGPSTSHVWVMEGDGSGKDRLTSGLVNDFRPVVS